MLPTIVIFEYVIIHYACIHIKLRSAICSSNSKLAKCQSWPWTIIFIWHWSTIGWTNYSYVYPKVVLKPFNISKKNKIVPSKVCSYYNLGFSL